MIDVVVVGGGAMGSAAAWRLAHKGLRVTLLERFDSGHVRGASHGASRIFRLVYDEPLYIDLARRALLAWRELEAESGALLLDITGGLDHGIEPVLTSLRDALSAQRVPYQIIAADAARERWPGLRFDGPALFQPDGGCLHADGAVAALQAAAARLGAEIHHERPVTAVRVRGDDLVEVDTPGGAVVARRAVVAAGAWAGKLLAGVVDLPQLTVTQEQPAYFALAPGAPERWPTFIHRTEPVGYGLLTPGAGIKIGLHGYGVLCDPDERDFRAEPGRNRQLLEYVREWVPGANPARSTPISCLYTCTDNHDFVIDRVGPLTVAAGFSGHGFKFVPEIGRMLADLAWDGSRPPARFSLSATR